ncbi:uncharacterized protein LOC129616197 [Condylostylus longicornis]|uniref:uncharacterized protein LOC129616197 n=1 Tax=Condylostylus longicornis TaxID=2530218 RepID=UPI00244DB014|nr:uncharacterized protein LOC129616197 [Condylostylus longicornis]
MSKKMQQYQRQLWNEQYKRKKDKIKKDRTNAALKLSESQRYSESVLASPETLPSEYLEKSPTISGKETANGDKGTKEINENLETKIKRKAKQNKNLRQQLYLFQKEMENLKSKCKLDIDKAEKYRKRCSRLAKTCDAWLLWRMALISQMHMLFIIV